MRFGNSSMMRKNSHSTFAFRSRERSFVQMIPLFMAIVAFFAMDDRFTLFGQENELPPEVSSLSDNRLTPDVIAVAKAKPAVVNIQGDKVEETVYGSKEAPKSFNGMGTGVLIDPRGYVVTNYHVIDGISNIQVTTADQMKYTASLVARDMETDLAVIKINSNKRFPVIKFGRSHDVVLAETVLAIGNPFGYEFTVTKGIVSGLGRKVPVNDTLQYRNAIQTDTAINPGNSGGPLLNLDGEMIGINAAIRQGAECIAFAIPVDLVLEASGKLINQMTYRSIYHGIQFRAYGKIDTLFISSIDPGSPADEAGIQAGDMLIGTDAEQFNSKLDFYRSLIDKKANDSLELKIERDGQEHKMAMKLINPALTASSPTGPRYGAPYNANRGNSTNPIRTGAPENPAKDNRTNVVSNEKDPIWDVLGIRVEPMSKEKFLKEYSDYRMRYPHGAVTIKEVRKGSPFELCELASGDILVGVHEWSTTSKDDLMYIASEWKGLSKHGKINIWLFRDGNHYYQEIEVR